MKKKIIIMILTVSLVTGCGKSIPKLDNGQEALIEFGDGTSYSVDEVWEEVKETYALDVVLDKIDKKILEEEYADREDEVQEYVDTYETSLRASYVDESGNYDEESLNNQLMAYGYNSIDEYLEQVRISYLQSLAATDYAKSLLTDKEIEDYYDDEVVGDIDCVHILIEPDSDSDEDDEAALEKAEEIIAAIQEDVKSGTSIADAFKKYEDDDEVTYQELGYFNKGEMESAFEEAAYDLAVDDYTLEPVKTSYGYHIIYKVDEKEKDVLDDVREDIEDTLAEEKLSDDASLSVNALIELRDTYGVTWYDSELEDAYNKYMNYLINQSSSN